MKWKRRKTLSLVVIGFVDESTAFDMRAKLAKLQKEYLIDMEVVVALEENAAGEADL